jgi:hypothetical protein
VVPRSGWGADESLRFDSGGNEIWPPAFWQIQKLIVHHTATQNNDPDPAATIRAIYYYHAVTQGWGDIGYNFLVDESGNVYEGRHSRTYAPGEAPTGEDLSGNGVTGAHAQGYNSGTVGIALLGTLTGRDTTPQARDALERLLAWKADAHGLDPQGESLYTNPVSGLQVTFPNIAGHRDVNATECPGNAFYATLPTIRSDVAARIAADTTPPSPPTGLSTTAGDGAVSLDWSDSPEPDLSGYRVYRRNPDGTWPSSPLATTPTSGFVDNGVTNGTTYAYRVTAYDGGGNESSPSSIASATPLGYPRPGGATPLRVPLVPAFRRCTDPNSNHVSPFDEPSCSLPVPGSSLLTTSSLGKQAALVRLTAMPGSAGTTEDEADVGIAASATDVKKASDGSDYTGDLIFTIAMRITDRANGFGSIAATVQDLDFSAPIPCTATADVSTGGSCHIGTTADTLVGGFAKEGKRALISTLSVKLLDAGPDGSITPGSGTCPPTCGTGDERPYLDQGIFAP